VPEQQQDDDEGGEQPPDEDLEAVAAHGAPGEEEQVRCVIFVSYLVLVVCATARSAPGPQ
jgi:hypothetical protein